MHEYPNPDSDIASGRAHHIAGQQHASDDKMSRMTTGKSGSRMRLPDSEIRQRMLAEGVEVAAGSGLTVSLEHLNYESIIAASGVSRTAVYRIWKNKSDFFADLLLELAGPRWAGTAAFDAQTLMVSMSAVVKYLDDLHLPSARRSALIAAARFGSQRSYQALMESREWRTYLALTASAMSLPDADQRRRIQTALAHAEDSFLGKMADFYKYMAPILGYQLRAEFGGDYRVLAAAGASVVEGMVMRRMLEPELAEAVFNVSAFGEQEEAWDIVSLAYTAILECFLEPLANYDSDQAREMLKTVMNQSPEANTRWLSDMSGPGSSIQPDHAQEQAIAKVQSEIARLSTALTEIQDEISRLRQGHLGT